MKKILKRIVAGALCVCMLSATNVQAKTMNQTKEVADKTSSEEMVIAQVVVPEEEVMQNIARGILAGEVVGNGVRLREKASSTSTVLELMYDGEAVKVNTSETVDKNGKKWYYVKRVKTGTWGYANSDYIVY